jgi:hypothetical protein
MKFLVPNYSCLQNLWLGGYRPTDPRSLCPLSSTEFVGPPPEQNSLVRHCIPLCYSITNSLVHAVTTSELMHINKNKLYMHSVWHNYILLYYYSIIGHWFRPRWPSSGQYLQKKTKKFRCIYYKKFIFFYRCAVHLDITKVFHSPTDAVFINFRKI